MNFAKTLFLSKTTWMPCRKLALLEWRSWWQWFGLPELDFWNWGWLTQVHCCALIFFCDKTYYVEILGKLELDVKMIQIILGSSWWEYVDESLFLMAESFWQVWLLYCYELRCFPCLMVYTIAYYSSLCILFIYFTDTCEQIIVWKFFLCLMSLFSAYFDTVRGQRFSQYYFLLDQLACTLQDTFLFLSMSIYFACARACMWHAWSRRWRTWDTIPKD